MQMMDTATVNLESQERQLPNISLFNFTLPPLANFTIPNLDNTTVAQFLIAVQAAVQAQLNQALSFFLTLIPRPASKSRPQPISIILPEQPNYQPYRAQRPFYPMAYHQFLAAQAPPYYMPQMSYYPQPSFAAADDSYARRPFPIDENLSDEEALEQLNIIKEQYESQDAENRFLAPSISISSDKQTIQIVKPNLTAAFSAFSSSLASFASAATNIHLTTTVTTKIFTFTGLTVTSG